MKTNKEERDKRIAHLPDVDPDIFMVRLNKVLNGIDIPMGCISEDCGITRDSVASYVRGRCMPNVRSLVYICQYLNVSADWLLGLSNERRAVW